MKKEDFRELAKRLGLKTGAELEKIIELENEREEKEERDAILRIPSPSHAQNDQNFTLSENYYNKYNLTRGDFPPFELDDALSACIDKFARVDIEYIASLCLLSLKDVILGLSGKIFKDPSINTKYFYEGYLTADEYLSGNLMKKYSDILALDKSAQRAYESNVKALKSVMPPKPKFEELFIPLGAPWIPASYIADFIQHLYRVSLVRNKRICEVAYQPIVNEWTIILNVDVRATVLASKTYGTERMDMFKILEKTLNHEQIRITDVEEENGKKSRKLNREQTMLAEEKRSRLKESFTRYLNDLPAENKQELIDIYYAKYGAYRARVFKGEDYSFKQKINGVELYDYQKNAVVRIMQSPSTLLAHDVGAGKTYAMIVSAHEMFLKRDNFKSMIVVPNSILAQWAEDYRILYPNAQILVVTPQDFAPGSRETTLQKMKNEQVEAILISYSTFEMIECGYKTQLEISERQLLAVNRALDENMRKKIKIRNKLNTLLQKRRDNLINTVYELKQKLESEQKQITFEDMNITALYIDEAHNYKNLPLDSSLGNIKGINVEGSNKCADVYNKTRVIKEKSDGRLIFATGTPITNSVADVFVMQKYLALSELEYCDVDSFDNWAGTFGEITRAYEIDVDTDNYRLTTRFNKFNNLVQLSSMLNLFTDFHVVGQDGLPEVDRIETVKVKKTDIQIQLLSEISSRVDAIRAGLVSRKEDNLLKVTTDGRKLALDARLVDNEACENTGNKINECAKNVANIYYAHPGKTQLVFCDIGTPKQGYNVYDHLKELLVDYGIDENQVGFVHDATSDLKRFKMFESVNNGDIRVLIGSTFKLGTGVNVQEKLIAIHHLDVPWRPSDMVQREGRLVRKGNTTDKVYIYRYITEGSFDAYSWQLLENKQRFITELLTGTAKDADERKLDDAVLSYAEVKALTIGNPLVKTRVETVNELSRLKALLGDEQKRVNEVERLKQTLPLSISELKQRLRDIRADHLAHISNPEIADKSVIAELISRNIAHNAMSSNEIFICSVNSFNIYLPSNFNRIRPYLVIQGKGRYTVDLVTFGMGAVIKIENFLNSLDSKGKEVYQNLTSLEMQLKQANDSANMLLEFEGKIEAVKQKLAEIDKELGL